MIKVLGMRSNIPYKIGGGRGSGGTFGKINVQDNIFFIKQLKLVLNTKVSDLPHPLVVNMTYGIT